MKPLAQIRCHRFARWCRAGFGLWIVGSERGGVVVGIDLDPDHHRGDGDHELGRPGHDCGRHHFDRGQVDDDGLVVDRCRQPRRPAAVAAGEKFAVNWTGPNAQGDYITIVAASTDTWTNEPWFHTKSAATPGSLVTPLDAGEYVLWYVTGADDATMATRPITVTPYSVSLHAAGTVQLGTTFTVDWTGPNGPLDYVTIVAAGSAPGTYNSFAYTQNGTPVTLTASDASGNYEIWYASDRVKDIVFGKISIVVTDRHRTSAVAAGGSLERRHPVGLGCVVGHGSSRRTPACSASYGSRRALVMVRILSADSRVVKSTRAVYRWAYSATAISALKSPCKVAAFNAAM